MGVPASHRPLAEAQLLDDASGFGGPTEAMHAVSRLLGTAVEATGPRVLAERLVREARNFFRVDTALLLTLAELEGGVQLAAMDPPASAQGPPLCSLTGLHPLSELLRRRETALRVSGAEAGALAEALGIARSSGAVLLLLPMRLREAVRHVLVLSASGERDFSPGELEVAAAFAAAATAGLAQLQLAAESAVQTAQQAALARAAKTLNESLDFDRVLVRICWEAASILEADNASVYAGNARHGLRVQATFGYPPDMIGARVGAGEGLAGKCVVRDEPMLTNDYANMPRQSKVPQFTDVRSCLAVPMRWDGELRGALSVGYTRPYLLTREHLSLLDAFGELAAVACRNASAHAGLAVAARTDALTGCLNHAALHDALRNEIERHRRTGHSLSLALVDLDDFKQVNELHGHQAGDEVLRRVGRALRQGVRAYDLVGRYGGDEFAILAVDADEREAMEVTGRAMEALTRSVSELGHAGHAAFATAGVAEWQPDEDELGVIARADRALLFGKQRGSRGVALPASEVPDLFLPSGSERAAVFKRATSEAERRDAGHEQTERLRRRTRQLALANALAMRVSRLTDESLILDGAVQELQRAFDPFLCSVLRIRDDGYLEKAVAAGPGADRLENGRWSQPLESGLIGRSLRQRRPVLSNDVRGESDYRLVPGFEDVRSELSVPIWRGKELWGAVDLEELHPEAFDEDDARVLQTVAGLVGSALAAAACTTSCRMPEAATPLRSR